MTIKDLSYATINSVNPLYLIINKINGHTRESNGNVWCLFLNYGKIRDLINSINNNSDNCYKKYMKIKFNSDDNLPLKSVRTL